MVSIFSGAMYSPCASLKMCFFLSVIFRVPFCNKPGQEHTLELRLQLMLCHKTNASTLIPDNQTINRARQPVCCAHRKPFPNVPCVQPSILVKSLCGLLRIFQVSLEYVWSFDAHLDGKMLRAVKTCVSRNTHMLY